jgi:NADH dehydrogenase
VARCQAALLQLLPDPPLTVDQVRSLERDNVVSLSAHTLADLGITPDTVEAVVPTYLDRYRRGGWYSHRSVA